MTAINVPCNRQSTPSADHLERYLSTKDKCHRHIMLMVIITVAMNTDIIQLIYVTAVICLNYNSKCHLVSLLMLCPLPLLLGQNSAYPNNGGSRFTHTIPVRINQTICFTLQKPKISVFWTDCRCKVKMSGNAKMQPARSFVLFVCCSFSDPVIMHTAIQH